MTFYIWRQNVKNSYNLFIVSLNSTRKLLKAELVNPFNRTRMRGLETEVSEVFKIRNTNAPHIALPHLIPTIELGCEHQVTGMTSQISIVGNTHALHLPYQQSVGRTVAKNAWPSKGQSHVSANRNVSDIVVSRGKNTLIGKIAIKAQS